MNEANIVYCVNKKFSTYLREVICSVLLNSIREINFFIIHSSIEESLEAELVEFQKKYTNQTGHAFKIFFIRFEARSALARLGLNDPLPWFNCFDIYTKLFVPEIIKRFNEENGTAIDKCIIMDVDMMATSNLEYLYLCLDHTEGVGGAIDEKAGNSSRTKVQHYLNAGLLLVNLSYLESIDFIHKCTHCLKINKEKFVCPEQDALNEVIPDDMKTVLPHQTVFLVPGNDFLKGKKRLLRFAGPRNDFLKGKTLLLHFAGIKPWHLKKEWNRPKFIWFAYRNIYRKILSGAENTNLGDTLIFYIFIAELLTPAFFLLNIPIRMHYNLRVGLRKLRESLSRNRSTTS